MESAKNFNDAVKAINTEDNIATQVLNQFKIDYEYVKEELELMMEQGYKEPKAEFPSSPSDDEGR